MIRHRLTLLGFSAVVAAILLVASLPGVAAADNHTGQPVYAQNNTSRPIWVAAKYIPPGGGRSFVTGGFWRVNPGEKVLIFYNNGVFAYFYARDTSGGVWRGNFPATVRGETVNMLEQNTTDRYDPFTMNFNP